MSHSPFAFATVDVFTDTPFTGNQLGIVHLPYDSPLPQKTKQAIAREFNFSESVFLYDARPGTTDRRLDIFTPTEELPFADTLPLELSATGCYDRESKMAEADIPHDVCIHQSTVPAMAVLSSQPELARLRVSNPPVVSIVKGVSHMLVDLSTDPVALKKLFGRSQKVEKGAVKLDEGWEPSFVGVYYYAVVRRDPPFYHVQARLLEESIGEDAATGSAASCLAVFLALKNGKYDVIHEFDIEQGVDMGRASHIQVKVELAAGGKEVKRVVLGGRAVLVTEGVLHFARDMVE